MHKKMMTLLLAAAFMFGAGCAPKHVVKNWEASGGSRADATVEVGFEYNPMRQIPDVNENQAYEQAVKRCQAWGYEDAEPFGMYRKICQQMINDPFLGSGCVSMLVTRQYQCLGGSNINPVTGHSNK